MTDLKKIGKILTKAEQKHILGGQEQLPPGCPDGEALYCCDYELTNETTGSENICATSEMNAKVKIINKYPNQVFSSDCSLA